MMKEEGKSATTSTNPPQAKRYLRNFLLVPRFQLRYTLAIVVAGAAIFGAMEYYAYGKVVENTELTELDGIAGDDPFTVELRERLLAEDRVVRTTLAGYWLALVVVLFIVGVMATHRIVGPIYVVDRYVRAVADGQPIAVRPLRRGDEFKELHQHVTEMAQALRRERVLDIERLGQGLENAAAVIAKLRESQRAEQADELVASLEVIEKVLADKQAYVDEA